MKSLLILLLACMAIASSAQEKILKHNVFFQSAQSDLEISIQDELNEFLKNTNNCIKAELRLVAYTDDVGSQKRNKQLAEARYKTVEQYIQSNYPKIEIIYTEAAGEIALSNQVDKEAERQNNRRVELILNAWELNDVGDVFNYINKDDYTRKSIDNVQSNIVLGEKGTILKIPANAFQDSSGTDVTNVNIKLREAYSYSDMLINNLATVSDGELLETGGMVYIEATNAVTGEKLSLKEGQSVEIQMPTNKPLPEGMQLFLSDREESAETSTNWAAVNQPFQQIRYVPFPPPPVPPRNLGAGKELSIEYQDVKSIEFMGLPNNVPTKPIAPKPLAKYRALGMVQPNKIDLKNEYPPKRGEAEKAYTNRIEMLYKQRVVAYEKAKKRYEQRVIQYEKDSIAQIEKLAKYHVATEAYHKHLANLYEPIRADLLAKQKELEKSISKIAEYTSGMSMNVPRSLVWELDRICSAYRSYKSLAERQQMIKTMDSLNKYQNQINPLRQLIFNQEKINSVNLSNAHCLGTCESSFDKENPEGLYQNFRKLQNNDLGMEDLAKLTKMMYGQIERFEKIRPIVLGNLKVYNSVFEIDFSQENVGTLTMQGHHVLDRCIQIYKEECKELGLDKVFENQNRLRNAISSSSLGWINCDRFPNLSSSERLLAHVNHQGSIHETLYVILPKMSSIFPLKPDVQKGKYVGFNIPKDSEVKVVAVKFDKDRVYTFTKNCVATDLENVSIEFEETAVDDLKNVLAVIN
ncbi:MAG: OmpA family protein [Saprospiraceae bacterium]|nr:OmpA family protein [Saprospiraceae bacterium]